MKKLAQPLVIINFKTFEQATGDRAIALAKICEKEAQQTGIEIAIAVQLADINSVSHTVSIPVLAQHVDDTNFGPYTGHVLAETLRYNGAVGSILNHSEKPLDLQTVKKCIGRLHACGLLAIACAGTPDMAVEIAKFAPDFIAIEPPELIGGTIAVSQAKPDVITATTRRVRKVPILCGAGITTKTDIQKAVKLGVKGILVASGIVRADNPAMVLRELLEGFCT